jgi:hypothetical protein
MDSNIGEWFDGRVLFAYRSNVMSSVVDEYSAFALFLLSGPGKQQQQVTCTAVRTTSEQFIFLCCALFNKLKCTTLFCIVMTASVV